MPPQSEFYCTTEWHLAQFTSKVAHLIYSWACNIAYKTKCFHVSPERAAAHFKLDVKAVRRAYRELTEKGWFILVEQGYYSPNTYQPLFNHDEWAKAHCGQCCEKMLFAWTAQNDKLGQALWSATGSKIKPKQHTIKALRRTMKEFERTEQEIVDEFKSWYPHQYHAPKYVMGHFIKHCRTQWKIVLPAAA